MLESSSIRVMQFGHSVLQTPALVFVLFVIEAVLTSTHNHNRNKTDVVLTSTFNICFRAEIRKNDIEQK